MQPIRWHFPSSLRWLNSGFLPVAEGNPGIQETRKTFRGKTNASERYALIFSFPHWVVSISTLVHDQEGSVWCRHLPCHSQWNPLHHRPEWHAPWPLPQSLIQHPLSGGIQQMLKEKLLEWLLWEHHLVSPLPPAPLYHHHVPSWFFSLEYRAFLQLVMAVYDHKNERPFGDSGLQEGTLDALQLLHSQTVLTVFALSVRWDFWTVTPAPFPCQFFFNKCVCKQTKTPKGS